MPPVGDLVVLAQRRPEVQRRRQRPAVRPATLDGAHDLGVEAEAGVEGEVPPVGRAKPDAALPARRQVLDEAAGRVDRIGGQAAASG